MSLVRADESFEVAQVDHNVQKSSHCISMQRRKDLEGKTHVMTVQMSVCKDPQCYTSMNFWAVKPEYTVVYVQDDEIGGIILRVLRNLKALRSLITTTSTHG